MKKYRTRTGVEIEEFEVVSETDHFITYIGFGGKSVKERKATSWQTWHETREQAFNFLKEQKEREIEALQSRIQRIQFQLDIIIKKNVSYNVPKTNND